MTFRLTVGPIPGKGPRELAVITEGGHPQVKGADDCVVCAVAWVDELPDADAIVWFKQQIVERPWETRQ